MLFKVEKIERFIKIIIDACSAILLGKITILEVFLSNKDTLITSGVYEEVIAGKEKKLHDALLSG